MKLLVLRPDNIGDLVLTTPVFAALRSRFPAARIDALVNSYNAPVLHGHPDVDRVHAYTKSKHVAGAGAALAQWRERLRQVLALRAERYDHVIVAAPGYHPRQVRLARWLRPRQVIAFCPPGERPRAVDVPVEHPAPAPLHHVEDTFRILAPLGIEGPVPAPRLAMRAVPASVGRAPRIALHVSARRPRNRWPEAHFAQLARRLHERTGSAPRLLWCPGGAGDPRHPGDDERARAIVQAAAGAPVEAMRTQRLDELIEALAACDLVVASDGGAMHLAAALGKPIVCLFGDSPPERWHPWGVPYRLLRASTHDARDIGVAQALDACLELAGALALAPGRAA